MTEACTIRVTVLYSPAPREVHEWVVVLAQGGTVLQALQASDLLRSFPEIDLQGGATIGVWGHQAQLEQVLHEQDRVEIYRPLKVDPKTARRKRFREQGSRAAGLFTRRHGG